MTNDDLKTFFDTHTWFDNSKIRIIRGCKRKAFFSLIGPKGVRLAAPVGDGANFGSCFHAGLARYYNGWGNFTEEIRRVHAARAFATEWGTYFPTDHMQSKHTLDRGLTILDAYFDHYLTEDPLFEPVEAELGFALNMGSFYYVGRIDGIWRRVADDTYWLRETKTTSSMAEKRLAQLKFDHQPLGYTACIRKIQPQYSITGFLGDVILVAATKLEFARDYFHVSDRDCANWQEQLINTVEDWRTMVSTAAGRADMAGQSALNTFHQDTERCFDYGKCAFYELCDYGISDDQLSYFVKNTWHPLLQRTPERIEIK